MQFKSKDVIDIDSRNKKPSLFVLVVRWAVVVVYLFLLMIRNLIYRCLNKMNSYLSLGACPGFF